MGRVEKMPKIDVIQYYRELLRVLQSNMIVLKEGLVVFFIISYYHLYQPNMHHVDTVDSHRRILFNFTKP